MTTKISQLPSLTDTLLISSTTAILPVVAGAGTLVTYQTSVANIKTYVSTGNLSVTGAITANLDSTFNSNLIVRGNLIVTGNTVIIGANNLATTDNIIELHTANANNSSAAWTYNDGKDIGVRFHYYTTQDRNGALVLAQDTKFLEWYNDGSEGNATIVGTSYGTIKTGELVLSNTTATISSSTGVLRTSGGAAIGGNIWITGTMIGQSTISTSGAATFASIISNGTASVGTTLSVASSATLNSLAVNNSGTIGTTLVTGGAATLNSLAVNTSAIISGTATVNALVSNGAIQGTTIGGSGNATVSSLTVNSSATIPTLGVSTSFTVPSIIHSGTDGTGNIGASGSSFNTVFAKATSAQYADLAEKYEADAEYDPGTVVIFSGDKEITVTKFYADTRIAGAISTAPAYLMNESGNGLPVALRGKIPVKVVGPVSKGDLLVSSETPGYAQRVGMSTTYSPNAVFAKSLVNDGAINERTIWAVIV
jgi:hypothetical protein